MKSRLGLCAASLTAAGLLLMPVAATQAQTPSAPPATKPAPSTSPSPTAISESKLDATATALKNVSVIRESYEQKVDKAPVEDKTRLQNEATAAMKKAVNDQGLSVEEYADIIEVAQSDPVVRNKLLQRLK